MMKKLLVIAIAILVNLSAQAHKSYISIANMEYVDSLQRMEVSLKMTAHDFEHIIEKEFNQHVHIEEHSDTSAIGQFVIRYIEKHFTLVSEGGQAQFHYVGREVTVQDDLFIYFTFTQIKNPKQFIISNTVLFDLFTEQQNIVHYSYHKQLYSVTLTPLIRESEINIKN